MNKKYAVIIALLLTILLANTINVFTILSPGPQRESAVLARVIDGDTLELEDKRIIRLLNINAPEKNFPGHNLSSSFLEQLINNSVKLEITGKDKYNRLLSRIYSLNGDYLNLRLVELGLATKFLVNENELKEFAEAEKAAINKEKGIWRKSDYYGCFTANINKRDEFIILESKCDVLNMRGWLIKDESRKSYIFPSILFRRVALHSSFGADNETDIFWNQKADIWNNDRDSLYLFDSRGKLAYYETYGY